MIGQAFILAREAAGTTRGDWTLYRHFAGPRPCVSAPDPVSLLTCNFPMIPRP